MSIKKEHLIVLFFIYFVGDNMLLFIKGFVVGIAKIIPGVSGAMLAINFNVYEKLINAVTNFFDDWKNNLKYILIFSSGLLLSIVLCSELILYLMNNYKFITMMFFIGLILGGTYNFSRGIIFNKYNILIIISIIILLLLLALNNSDNNYLLKHNIYDYIIFFIGGIIEIAASIIPGISGTSILMMMGIYNQVLLLMSNVFNISYIINNISLYISYSMGMIISFIITSYLMNYLFKKYRNFTNALIFGLSLGSIIILLTITFKISFSVIEFILGIMLLTVGLLISSILDK